MSVSVHLSRVIFLSVVRASPSEHIHMWCIRASEQNGKFSSLYLGSRGGCQSKKNLNISRHAEIFAIAATRRGVKYCKTYITSFIVHDGMRTNTVCATRAHELIENVHIICGAIGSFWAAAAEKWAPEAKSVKQLVSVSNDRRCGMCSKG